MVRIDFAFLSLSDGGKPLISLVRATRSGPQQLEGHQFEFQMQGVASTNPEQVPSQTRLVSLEASVRYLECLSRLAGW